jgi:nanoRNase/pAp phosphatase (c-di-AMP/oligoRNAs hydrolase)
LSKASRVRAQSQTFTSLVNRSGILKNRYGSVLIFTHRQADPDALCSAYAVSQLLVKGYEDRHRISDVTRGSKIITPQGASMLGLSICKALSIPFDDKIDSAEIENADLIVLVDVGDKELLEPYLVAITNSKAKKILIDHHSSTDAGTKTCCAEEIHPYDYIFVDSKATSTCEIITLGLPLKLLDQNLAKVLLVGLLYDSQHLAIATDKTLEAALKLVRNGARIDQAKELLRSRPERSEMIARLKSSQRLKYREIGKYLLAETQVSSFQAAVARMLLDIGADVGIAFGEHEDEVRISVRTTQRFFRETGIDMGVLLSNISRESGITGGGHSTAASISGKTSSEALLGRIISDLMKALP